MNTFKKMAVLIFAGLMMFICVGCSDEPQTAVCTKEDLSGIQFEMTFDAEGDTVIKMVQKTTVPVSHYSEEQLNILFQNQEVYKEAYEVYDGVSYETGSEGDILYEILTIDTTNTDSVASLKALNLLPIQGGTNWISFQETTENLEKQGWTVEIK